MCGDGFACVEGVCKSACNPPCAADQVCAGAGRCTPAVDGSTDASPGSEVGADGHSMADVPIDAAAAADTAEDSSTNPVDGADGPTSLSCPDPGGETLNGSFIVRNDIDVATLSRYSVITGDLTIDQGLSTVSLPTLTKVNGTIKAEMISTLERVEMPALRSTGGLRFYRNPKLSGVSFDCVASTGPIRVEGNALMKTLVLPSLTTAGHELVVEFASPSLIDLPRLGETSGLIHLYATTIRLPSLKRGADFRFGIGSDLDLSNMVEVKGMSIVATGSVKVTLNPSLNVIQTVAEGDLVFQGNAGGQLTIVGLETAEDMWIYGAVHLPDLRSAGLLRLVSTAGNAPSLPKLGEITGVSTVELVADLTLPGLRQAQDLSICTYGPARFAAPELTSARTVSLCGRRLTDLGPAPPTELNVSLPKLAKVAQLSIEASEATIDLSGLGEVGAGGVTLIFSKAVSMPGVTAGLSLPALKTVGGSLKVFNSGTLNLQLGALMSVGGAFEIQQPMSGAVEASMLQSLGGRLFVWDQSGAFCSFCRSTQARLGLVSATCQFGGNPTQCP
jgi:hypothetical protein